jgi:hypothetical protein
MLLRALRLTCVSAGPRPLREGSYVAMVWIVNNVVDAVFSLVTVVFGAATQVGQQLHAPSGNNNEFLTSEVRQ